MLMSRKSCSSSIHTYVQTKRAGLNVRLLTYMEMRRVRKETRTLKLNVYPPRLMKVVLN